MSRIVTLEGIKAYMHDKAHEASTKILLNAGYTPERVFDVLSTPEKFSEMNTRRWTLKAAKKYDEASREELDILEALYGMRNNAAPFTTPKTQGREVIPKAGGWFSDR